MPARFVITALFALAAAAGMRSFASKADSLLKVLEGNLHDTARVNTLSQLAGELRNSSPREAFTYAEAALKLSEKIEWKKGMAVSHNMLGTINKNLANMEEARKHHEEALAIYTSMNDRKGIAASLNGLGLAIHKLGDYRSALECYLKSLSIAKELKDEKLEGKLYNNIGLVYDNLDESEKALDHFRKYMEHCERTNDEQGLMTSYGNIALIYLTQHDSAYFNKGKGPVYILAKSIEYSSKALAISQRLDQKAQQVYIYFNTGEAWMYLTEKAVNGAEIELNGKRYFLTREAFLDSAETAFNKGIAIGEHVGDRKSISHIYSGFSKVYLSKKEYKKALLFGEKAYFIADSLGLKHRMMNAAMTISKCYKAMGDYMKALEWYERSEHLQDMLMSEEKQKDLGRLEAKFEYERKMIEQNHKHEKEQAIAAEEATRQRTFTFTAIGGAAVLGIFTLVLFNRFSVTRRHKRIIEEQKQQVDLAFDQLHARNKEVLDSINYSKRIQSAILPTKEYLREVLGKHFIFFRPKDIVSGDFYWAYKTPAGQVVWVVADCTGHGVPGALMSMLGHTLLNEIIADKGVVKAADILDRLREKVVSMLEQKGSGLKQNDGMDIALCVMNANTRELEFAGANNPCWIIRNNELLELKPDKMPVGAYSGPVVPFGSRKTMLEPGDTIYLFTDGYADQFGGESLSLDKPNGKKFKYSRLKELLISIHAESAEKQEQLLAEAFDSWKGGFDQVDDVCVIGVRV